MPLKHDLDAAAVQGIVTPEQAAALHRFIEDRNTTPATALSHEERFRFMRGFNDFFFAVGIALFLGGIAFFTIGTPATSLLAAAIVWALSELLVARMRLVLPGILLSTFFIVFFAAGSPADFLLIPSQFSPDFAGFRDWLTTPRVIITPVSHNILLVLAVSALSGAFAALLYYARFRLPFALLLVAACLVGAVLAWTQGLAPRDPTLASTRILLACGVVIFATAMAFDMSDRERTTRRADCAFWLHLLAAPLIVHSLVKLVTQNLSTMTPTVAATIMAIFAGLALVAIVIDRRALLVSGLAYLGAALAYGMEGAAAPSVWGKSSSEKVPIFFQTISILGFVVLVIGIGWRPLRRLLLRLVPSGLATRLPPVEIGPTPANTSAIG